MNNIIKFLLAGDEPMPEIHLAQAEFKYNPCGLFTKKQNKNTKIQRNRRF